MSLASLLLPDGDLRVIRCDIADKLIACADADSALLYLYLVRMGKDFQQEAALRDLNMSQSRMERAVFTLTSLMIQQQAEQETIQPKQAEKPRYTLAELRQARETDHKFSAVCDAAEDVLGQVLSEAHIRSLYLIYDHIGMPAEVMIELLTYLRRDRGAVSRRDIEREAYRWADMGIYTLSHAQQYLAQAEATKPIQMNIFEAMEIIGRAPSPSERDFAERCMEKGFPPETVALAMRRMKTNIGKFSLNYLKKILNAWHEKGVHTVAEITAIEPEIQPKQQTPVSQNTEQLAQWELDWIEQMQRRQQMFQEEEAYDISKTNSF